MIQNRTLYETDLSFEKILHLYILKVSKRDLKQGGRKALRWVGSNWHLKNLNE